MEENCLNGPLFQLGFICIALTVNGLFHLITSGPPAVSIWSYSLDFGWLLSVEIFLIFGVVLILGVTDRMFTLLLGLPARWMRRV